MTLVARSRSAEETRELAGAIGALLRTGDVVVLAGELGSGKTTFAQGAIAALGVDEPVTSPTFALVKEYEGDRRVAHVDVYRLDHIQELHDLGFEEVVDDGRVTFVEWGDRVNAVLPTDRIVVRISAGDADDHRVVSVEPTGPSWAERDAALRDAVARFGG